MAKFLILDKKLYGPNGTIPLKKGDDWNLFGKIVEKYAGYQKELDLSGMSATAYFPAATGGSVQVAMSITNAECGSVSVSVDSAITSGLSESENGLSMYAVLEDSGKEETVETADWPLEILSRGFSEG